ncbi:MauE/DoxX family redox-associated membrane protein [Mucilaginibacter lutimaris]|uniref:MauE/DoxX family redox-associated membrane protein n=1 Tax=Mucilaginibacter lutimaris TaxID=931629 RepID=A0ABW2ZEH8_9SPHI
MLIKKGITENFIKVATGLIALLWLYAAISKLIDHDQFKVAMSKQPFHPVIQNVLVWALPPVEALTGAALLTDRFVKPGICLSAIMFILFTGYIAMIFLRFFGHIPCSCGGLIEKFGWKFHFWFNLTFLALNLIIITNYQRKESGDI